MHVAETEHLGSLHTKDDRLSLLHLHRRPEVFGRLLTSRSFEGHDLRRSVTEMRAAAGRDRKSIVAGP
jgi:hypothetical protein